MLLLRSEKEIAQKEDVKNPTEIVQGIRAWLWVQTKQHGWPSQTD